MRIRLAPAGRVVARLAAVLAFLAGAQAASAQVALITDAEIETFIKDLARPLMAEGGLGYMEPRVVIVRDRGFNAFVTEDGTIYVNYGLIIDSQAPGELRAVLAHEIAHLAGGHLARLRQNMQTNAVLQVVSSVLGAGAMVAGIAAGQREISGMAGAFMMASQSVGQNSLMAYRRSEETTADAGALSLLRATQKSPRGMITVLERLEGAESSSANASPYLRSHPLAADRLNQVRQAAQQSPYFNTPDSAAEIDALALVKAKLVGFLESQTTTLSRYPNSDRSLAARYARVISAYVAGGALSAIQLMPQLIAERPGSPYLHELYGQMLLETGQAQAALAPLSRALALAPNQPEIRVLYGHALVDAGGAANLAEAIGQLSRVANEDRDSVRAYVLLSRAYERAGRPGDASLAAAEAALARGDTGVALGLARQAQAQLTAGTPAWLRADDILNLD